MNNQTTGKIGEDLACEYLKKKGCKILHRNYREKWDEIDIIAKDKRQTIVFVEVKTLIISNIRSSEDRRLVPEDNITTAKLRKLRRACQAFAIKNEDLTGDERGWRIDLVAVELVEDESEGGKEEKKEQRTVNYGPTIRHYENI